MSHQLNVSKIVFDRICTLTPDPNGGGLLVNGSGVGGGSSNIPSDVLRATGSQDISGVKTFYSGLRFGAIGVAPYGHLNDYFSYFDYSGVRAFSQNAYNANPNIHNILVANFPHTQLLTFNNDYYQDGDPVETTSVNWGNRTLVNSQGNNTLLWNIGWAMYPDPGSPSMSWTDANLYINDPGAPYIYQNISLDWNNRILSGNWSTNTPTGTGHAATKGYVDSANTRDGYRLNCPSGVFMPSGNSTFTVSVNQTSNTLDFRVQYSNGTIKSGSLALV